MKAAVLEKIDGPLTIAEVGLGDLSFGQVLVKVLVSGICGAQLQEIAGHKGNAKFLPHLLGHEGCGIVEDIGLGVTRVKKGDKVVMHWRKGEGVESDFPTYEFKGRQISSGKVTTFSEYSIVSENRLTPVPHDTPDELCALLGCGLATALGTVNLEAQLKLGESVMILGCGGLGVNLIKAAQLAGASIIISVDIHEHKRTVARELGASLYINVAKENIADTLREKLGISKVDVIIETSGSAKSIEETVPLLSGTGRYILVGQPKPGESVSLKNANHLFEGEGKMIKATQGGSHIPTRDIPRYIKLYKTGALKTDGIITHRITLDQINEGIELVRKGEAGRVLITMTDTSTNAPQDAYQRMLRIRVAEEELAKLYLEKKIMSFVHFCVGQEAVAVGVCDNLTNEDRTLGNHRSHGHYLAKGGDLKRMVYELLSKQGGVASGKGGSMHMIDKSVGFIGSTPILGSVVPLACGSAFEQKYNKRNSITVAFFGDGAFEEGVVYETLNLAALFSLPILFVVENNLYSVNSKLKERRSPNHDVEKIVTGFGRTYQKADGLDYGDVFRKAGELVRGIRTGKGPALLECMTYRHMAHSAPLMDDAAGYREEDVLERRLEKDAVKKMRERVLAQGVKEGDLVATEAKVRAEVADAIQSALVAPYPDPKELYTDLYA